MPGDFWLRATDAFVPVTFFVFGCIVGSFLNVCIHRMPLDQSLLRPPSHCPKCQSPIPWRLNIPLLAWLWLKGRCANCRAPIPWRYPMVELLTGLLFAAAWLRMGSAAQLTPAAFLAAAVLCVFLAGLITATFIDLDHYIIPDRITYGGMAAGLAASLVSSRLLSLDSVMPLAPASALARSAVGCVVGGAMVYAVVRVGKWLFGRQTYTLEPGERLLFAESALRFADGEMPYEDIFYRESDAVTLHASRVELLDRCYTDVDVRLTMTRLTIGSESFRPEEVPHLEVETREVIVPREAMGLGDVKFMAAIGAFLGWQATVFSLMASALLGALVGVTLMAIQRGEYTGRMPYGPFIAVAAALWVFGGHALWRWWFESMRAPF